MLIATFPGALGGVTTLPAFDTLPWQSQSPHADILERRAATLFCFGLIVNSFPYFNFHTMRIYGVLQRIAICYLIAGLFYLWDRKWQSKAVVVVAALIGYWILMRWVPVPGFGMPGRDIPFLDKDINWVSVVDRRIFPGRLLENTRDPLGLISTIPAVATCLLGVLTGLWLRTQRRITYRNARAKRAKYADEPVKTPNSTIDDDFLPFPSPRGW